MTFVIIFVFILCWSPYIVFDLLQVWIGISDTWNQIRNLNLQVYDCIPNNSTNRAVATFIQGPNSIMKSEWGQKIEPICGVNC